MTVFAAIAPEFSQGLEDAVLAKFPDGNHYKVAPGQYLIFAPNVTTQQLSETIGATNGPLGRVMVLRVTNYAGWHARDMWEWISNHLTPPTALPETSGGQ
jgi:hypothetical protein